MGGAVNEIWGIITLLMAGLALVGVLSDYSGRDFDLPAYFHELFDVRYWQKSRGSANVLILAGLAVILLFNVGGIEMLPLNPPVIYIGIVLIIAGIVRTILVHQRANLELYYKEIKHKSRISIVALAAAIYLLGSSFAAVFPYIHIYPWKIGPVSGMSSFSREYWLRESSDLHNFTLQVGKGKADPTGAEILIWNYCDSEISFDPSAYELRVYFLWNLHNIEVETPKALGQKVVIEPQGHATVKVDWSEVYGSIPKSSYNIAFDFYVDGTVERHAAGFEIE